MARNFLQIVPSPCTCCKGAFNGDAEVSGQDEEARGLSNVIGLVAACEGAKIAVCVRPSLPPPYWCPHSFTPTPQGSLSFCEWEALEMGLRRRLRAGGVSGGHRAECGGRRTVAVMLSDIGREHIRVQRCEDGGL